MRWMVLLALGVAMATGLGGCDCGGGTLNRLPDGGLADGGGHDGGLQCTAASTDFTGCACNTPGQQRSCYPDTAATNTDGVGVCHDGVQTCTQFGELLTFGPCIGAVTPTAEICNDGVDNDCNGETDCNDIACYSSAQCNSNCTNGQTRPCWTGPTSNPPLFPGLPPLPGPRNTGLCHDGLQTCSGNVWGACTGEVLPTQPNCSDTLDHACDTLPGCLNPACLGSAACNSSGACDAGVPFPGCVCANGGGDTATCPAGTYDYIDQTGTYEACCPCTANDCGNAACCATSSCTGNSACANLTCPPLQAQCNGQIDQDCDDFSSGSNYEDCDEPCCPCYNCPNCAIPGKACSTGSDCCSTSCTHNICD